MSSGDFTGIAELPQPVDMEALVAHAAAGALNDIDLSGHKWGDIPLYLAEYAFDIVIHDLIKAGHANTPIAEFAVARGIIHTDGSWC